MKLISFVLTFLLTTLMLLVPPNESHADFAQIYGKYDSYSIFSPSRSYNPTLALLSAAVSDDVYNNAGNSALVNAGFFNFNFTNTANDMQAVTAMKNIEGKRVIAIVFRGTTPSAMLDVVYDLAAFGTIFRPDHNQDEVIVHQGFWLSMMDYYANREKRGRIYFQSEKTTPNHVLGP